MRIVSRSKTRVASCEEKAHRFHPESGSGPWGKRKVVNHESALKELESSSSV